MESGNIELRGSIDEDKAIVASAATLVLSTVDANYIEVTGTTTITAIDTIQAGASRTLVFDASLVLTHNPTSFILETGANITTQAGDSVVFRSEGAGKWRSVGYTRADGTPLVSAAINTGKTLWVDAINGNNATALPARLDKPYLDPWAAVAAASAGDVVHVLAGSYTRSGALDPNLLYSGVSLEAFGQVSITNNSSNSNAILENSSAIFGLMRMSGDFRLSSATQRPICNVTAGAIDIDITSMEIDYDGAGSNFISLGTLKLDRLTYIPSNPQDFTIKTTGNTPEIKHVRLGGAGNLKSNSSVLSIGRITNDGTGQLFCLAPATDAQAIINVESVENCGLNCDSSTGFAKIDVKQLYQSADGMVYESVSTANRNAEIEVGTFNGGIGSLIAATFNTSGAGNSIIRIKSQVLNSLSPTVNSTATGNNEIDLGSTITDTTATILFNSSGAGRHSFATTPTDIVGKLIYDVAGTGYHKIKIGAGNVNNTFGVKTVATTGELSVELPASGELILNGGPYITSPSTCYILFDGNTNSRMVSGRLRSTYGSATNAALLINGTALNINKINNFTAVLSGSFTYSINGNALGSTVYGAGFNSSNLAYNLTNVTPLGSIPFIDAGVL